MSNYPEHEKMAEVMEQCQAIGDFLEWAVDEKGLYLCEVDSVTGLMMPYRSQMVELLAERFGVDLKVIEEEKRAMLDELRSMQ